MIAPEPFLSAYLKVVHSAILESRFLSLRMQKTFVCRLSRRRCEQVADLQDAIHVIVEKLGDWEGCDEPALRRTYLKAYDEKWFRVEGDLSLLKVFEMQMEDCR